MLQAWVSWLALGVATGPSPGQALFNDPGLGRHGVSCAACHATTESEDDGLLRAGHTLFGVAGRTHWRGDEDKGTYRTLADAVDPCVQIYLGGPNLTPRSRAELAGYLESLGGNERRPPIQILPALQADENYARPQYERGIAARGRGLFYRACHGCHPHGNREGLGGVLVGKDSAEIAAAVREGTGLLRGQRKVGRWMPFYGKDRLTDSQIADIAAYLATVPAK